MKYIHVKKDCVTDGACNIVDTSDVYNLEFLNDINNESKKIKFSSDYINEIFLYFYLPFFEKASYIKKMLIKEVKLECWSGIIWYSAAKKNGLSFSIITTSGCFLRACYILITSCLIIFALSAIFPVYTLFKFRRYNNYLQPTKAFAIIRSPATFSKMSFLESEDVVFFCDDLIVDSFRLPSIYQAPLSIKLLSLLYVPIFSIFELFVMFNDAKKMLGFLLACDVVKYYIKRIPHKVNFQFYAERLLKNNRHFTFYTGNKEDRFALLEKRLCSKHGLKCICIPHGLEYSFKMPAGLVGDVFYCNSLYAKEYFENIYADTETDFIFDESVVTKMLFKNKSSDQGIKLIFFPESREPEKNLDIIKMLKIWKIKFYIKLHIKDCIDNYLPYISQDMLVEDFNEAISNNICLARKSTVLLEAIYNQSTSIAVLVDSKDRSFVELMFPSLNDENILKVYSFEQLKKILDNLKVSYV